MKARESDLFDGDLAVTTPNNLREVLSAVERGYPVRGRLRRWLDTALDAYVKREPGLAAYYSGLVLEHIRSADWDYDLASRDAQELRKRLEASGIAVGSGSLAEVANGD